MKRRLRNSIALFGAILTLAIAIPSFTQYREGWIRSDFYYTGSQQSERDAQAPSQDWRGSRRWCPNCVGLFYFDHPEWPAMDSPQQNEEGDFDSYNQHGA